MCVCVCWCVCLGVCVVSEYAVVYMQIAFTKPHKFGLFVVYAMKIFFAPVCLQFQGSQGIR